MITDKELEEFEKIEKATTAGPWVFGDWISYYNEDGKPQEQGESYWILKPGDWCLARGPYDRKSNECEWDREIIHGMGYEFDGLRISENDKQFIAACRTMVPRLVDEIKRLKNENQKLLRDYETHTETLDEKWKLDAELAEAKQAIQVMAEALRKYSQGEVPDRPDLNMQLAYETLNHEAVKKVLP